MSCFHFFSYNQNIALSNFACLQWHASCSLPLLEEWCKSIHVSKKLEVEMRKTILSVILGALMLASVSAAYAEVPSVNVSRRLHPNLAAAQKLSRQAYDKITRAQKANQYDMEGHAQKAKDL